MRTFVGPTSAAVSIQPPRMCIGDAEIEMSLREGVGFAPAAVTLDVSEDLFDADTDALRAALDRVASRPSRVDRRSEPKKKKARDQGIPDHEP